MVSTGMAPRPCPQADAEVGASAAVPRAAAATRAKLILRNMMISPLVVDVRSASSADMSRSASQPFSEISRAA
jgi:hypothetical protein